MMTTHDAGAPPPGRLPDDTIAALREALRHYLSNGRSPEPLQAALMLVAQEARDKHVLPEQLLVILKEIWGSLPEVRTVSNTEEQVRLLQRVVTMCIKEYYGA